MSNLTFKASRLALGGAIAGLVLTLLLRPESFNELLQQIANKFG